MVSGSSRCEIEPRLRLSLLFAIGIEVASAATEFDDGSELTLAALCQRAEKAFSSKFGGTPELLVAAPGRVNLIGEHVDYNDGWVLPMAIERYVVIAAAVQSAASPAPASSTARCFSTALGETISVSISDRCGPTTRGWGLFVEGVISEFIKSGATVPALDAVIISNVPPGGGLSSSAALEVALATTLESLAQHPLDPREKALLCQRVEHQFVGVPCGIMDQFSSVFGKPNELMLLDCMTQTIRAVPFPEDGIEVLIINSNVQHELASGQYARRRCECDSALAKFGKQSWRAVDTGQWKDDQLAASSLGLTAVEQARARHVVTEIERTLQAAEAFAAGDWPRVGQLMNASHASLRDDYEVSCPEVDTLVELTQAIGPAGGVFGSRMTGGGFGGCTVTLVESARRPQVVEQVLARYLAKTGIVATAFASRPALGAHRIENGLS